MSSQDTPSCNMQVSVVVQGTLRTSWREIDIKRYINNQEDTRKTQVSCAITCPSPHWKPCQPLAVRITIADAGNIIMSEWPVLVTISDSIQRWISTQEMECVFLDEQCTFLANIYSGQNKAEYPVLLDMVQPKCNELGFAIYTRLAMLMNFDSRKLWKQLTFAASSQASFSTASWAPQPISVISLPFLIT